MCLIASSVPHRRTDISKLLTPSGENCFRFRLNTSLADGIAAGEPTECFNPTAVVMRAEALSRKEGHVGAVAFSRTGDPATGDFGDAKVTRRFGDIPDDLSAL
jgi:hypothetical protein